jgi:hypothetical protein
MDDGSLATLDAVIEYYARGGLDNPNLARELHPLRLSQQDRRDLVAFLDSLTGTRPRVGAPSELPAVARAASTQGRPRLSIGLAAQTPPLAQRAAGITAASRLMPSTIARSDSAP